MFERKQEILLSNTLSSFANDCIMANENMRYTSYLMTLTAAKLATVMSSESTPAMKAFDAVPTGGSRGIENPLLRWKDEVKSDLVSLGISNWRQTAERRDE